jgi:hypothetical protein
MRCVVCGATMRLEEIVPAKIIRAPGYEYRSFRCLTCSAVERRLAFTPQKQFSTDPVPPRAPTMKSVAKPSQAVLAELAAWALAIGKLRRRQDRGS